jgi:hypothetical protein
MSVDDYLIDHTGFDWAQLLDDWRWLLPAMFTVWLVNRYGDLFMTTPDGCVHMLDVGAGTLTQVADNRDDFVIKIDEDNNANDWLMIPLVDRLVSAGMLLKPGECYSLVLPPIVGGDYTIENTAVRQIAELYAFNGSIHEQMRDVQDGEEVIFTVKDPRSP